MAKKARKNPPVDSVRKGANGWEFRDPEVGEWMPGYASREAARKARSQRVQALRDGVDSEPDTEDEVTVSIVGLEADPAETSEEMEDVKAETEAMTTAAQLNGPVSEALVSDSAESSCIEEQPTVVSEALESSDVSEPSQPESQEKKTMQTITLTKSRTNKGNATLFGQSGVLGSVRVPKSVFADGATIPETITITAPDGTFALPGAKAVKATTEEQAAKIKAAAEKAEARAKKAQEKADKAKAKLAALEGAKTETAPAQA